MHIWPFFSVWLTGKFTFNCQSQLYHCKRVSKTSIAFGPPVTRATLALALLPLSLFLSLSLLWPEEKNEKYNGQVTTATTTAATMIPPYISMT